jgi:hypothetical protein
VRWFEPNLRSSLYGLLGPAFAPSQSADRFKTDEIRERRWTEMGQLVPCSLPAPRSASDMPLTWNELWRLRPNLMAELAATYGEDAARLQVATVTVMFDGLLPRGLKPRPSPLGFALRGGWASLFRRLCCRPR